MYLVVLQGHGTSSWPSSRGAPRVWTAFTKKPSVPSSSRTAWPMRVMVRMETATYAESVISTPMAESGEPTGPMQKGTTYMVRPRMDPRKTPSAPVKISRISAGSFQ